MKPRLLVASITLILCAQARTEMITIGEDQTAGTGTLTLNYDLVFTITNPATANLLFVFDEVASSDGTYARASFTGLEFSINGGNHLAIQYWFDNTTAPTPDITSNDGFLYSTALSTLTINDIVTLHAGTGTMTGGDMIPSGASFNPWTSGDYTVFITTNGGTRLSIDAVPEPATAGLLGISALALYGIRRIKNFNRA